MNHRSPRFPFVPLEEALDALAKFDNAIQSGESPKRPTFLKALGYSSDHGAAVKVFAALRGYDLIARAAGDEPGIRVTELGRELLDRKNPENRQAHLRRAALSPPMFRRIWRKARHFDHSELVDALILKGFTDSGARRAARIYRANSELAQLEELTLEPDLPSQRPGGPKQGPARRAQRQRLDNQRRQQRVAAALDRDQEASQDFQRGAGKKSPPHALILPLSTGRATIPAGITADEFQTLMQTLRLWKSRLVNEESVAPKETEA